MCDGNHSQMQAGCLRLRVSGEVVLAARCFLMQIEHSGIQECGMRGSQNKEPGLGVRVSGFAGKARSVKTAGPRIPNPKPRNPRG